MLDIARFKLPPYWVGIADLYRAMAPVDADTGKPRGYALLAQAADRTGQVAGAERSMAQLGGGGAVCPVTPVKIEFCPVRDSRARVVDHSGGDGGAQTAGAAGV